MDFKNFINYLLILGSIQGFILIAFTFSKKKIISPTVFYLNLIVLFLSLNNLQAFISDNDYFSSFFFLKNLIVPWYIFIVPMFYQFITHYLKIEDNVVSFTKLTCYLFGIELIVRVMCICLVYFLNYETNFLIESYSRIEEILNAIYFLVIFVRVFSLIFKRPDLQDFIIKYDDLKWIKLFLILGIFIHIIWFIAMILYNVGNYKFMYSGLQLCTSIVLYWIAYQGLYRYNIIDNRIFLRKKILEKEIALENNDYFNTKHLNDFNKIKEYVISNQRYLECNLSREKLAEELDFSVSHLSKVINRYSQYGFSDFINYFRVEQAKKLLDTKEFDKYTTNSIGLECGFNSRSTFYAAFKKLTGFSPAKYRENGNQLYTVDLKNAHKPS